MVVGSLPVYVWVTFGLVMTNKRKETKTLNVN